VPAVPEWLVPPHEGWHFEDLLALPLDGSQHIELIDGAFIPMSAASKFHVQVIRNLQALLDRLCPESLRADSETVVRIDDNGPHDSPVIYTSELDAASVAYEVTGIFHHRLKLSVPFPIDLDLGELTQ